MKDYAKQSMLLRNQKKIVSDLYTITLANNQPKVNVLDETKIPLDFFEEIREMKLDKKLLKDYLKDHEWQLETTNKNAIERLKDYAKQSMLLRNQKKIVSDLYTITLANNQPKVNVLDETKIPLSFFEEIREMKLDKKSLKDYLKDHECEGAELVQSQSIRIR